MIDAKIKLNFTNKALEKIPGAKDISLDLLLEDILVIYSGGKYKPGKIKDGCISVKDEKEFYDSLSDLEQAPRQYLISKDGSINRLFYKISKHKEGTEYYYSVDIMKAPTYLSFGNGNFLWSELEPFTCLQSNEVLGDMVKSISPYLYQFCVDNNFDLRKALLFSKVEILYKAGYKFAERIVEGDDFRIKEVRGLCSGSKGKGTSPRTIIDLPYYALKKIKSLPLEEVYKYRTLTRYYRIQEAEVNYIWDLGLKVTPVIQEFWNPDGGDNQNESQNFYTAMRRVTKTPYLWYFKYFSKIDFKSHGIDNLSTMHRQLADYLKDCDNLNVKVGENPKYFWEEHTRVSEIKRNNMKIEEDRKAKARIDAMKRYEYDGCDFFIRCVRSQPDIIDEGQQQSNCVASYWNRVSRGETMIFFMRKITAPEKSYITIEYQSGSIRQALMHGNRSIDNKPAQDFLKEWKCYINYRDKIERKIERYEREKI